MELISQYFPLCMLILCDILYVFENRLKRLFNAASVILHVLAVIYFLTAEFPPEILLLFLLASFAAAVTLTPKLKDIQEK